MVISGGREEPVSQTGAREHRRAFKSSSVTRAARASIRKSLFSTSHRLDGDADPGRGVFGRVDRAVGALADLLGELVARALDRGW